MQCNGLTLNPMHAERCMHPDCQLDRVRAGKETPSKPVVPTDRSMHPPLKLPFTIAEEPEELALTIEEDASEEGAAQAHEDADEDEPTFPALYAIVGSKLGANAAGANDANAAGAGPRRVASISRSRRREALGSSADVQHVPHVGDDPFEPPPEPSASKTASKTASIAAATAAAAVEAATAAQVAAAKARVQGVDAVAGADHEPEEATVSPHFGLGVERERKGTPPPRGRSAMSSASGVPLQWRTPTA